MTRQLAAQQQQQQKGLQIKLWHFYDAKRGGTATTTAMRWALKPDWNNLLGSQDWPQASSQTDNQATRQPASQAGSWLTFACVAVVSCCCCVLLCAICGGELSLTAGATRSDCDCDRSLTLIRASCVNVSARGAAATTATTATSLPLPKRSRQQSKLPSARHPLDGCLHC